MRKLRKAVIVSVTACIPIVAIPINEFLVGRDIPQLLSIIFVMMMSIVIALVSYFLLPVLLCNFHFVRMWFEPLARFEGQWACSIKEKNEDKGDNESGEKSKDEVRVCGVLNFVYNQHERSWVYSGECFDDKGKIVTTFTVVDIKYSKEIHGFRYYGKTMRAGSVMTTINGYGEINFIEPPRSKRINSAHGYFVNSGTDLAGAIYYAERIEKKDSKKLKDQKERALYAKKFYEDYHERSKSEKSPQSH